MKKLLLSIGLLFTTSLAHADLFQSVKDKSMTVSYRLAVAGAVSTHTILVDLSSTTIWPHKDVGQLNISSIRLNIDKTAASTCTVQIGVVNFVSGSTGSVTWFYTQNSERNVSNTNIQPLINLHETFYRCRVDPNSRVDQDGSTPYLLSSVKTSGSTIYQTDVILPNPANVSITPGTGDIVMNVSNGTTAVEVYVEVTYHSQPR